MSQRDQCPCPEARNNPRTPLIDPFVQQTRSADRARFVATVVLLLCSLLIGCAPKKQAAAPTPPPIRSQMPPPNAETIEHCVVTSQENSNTVTCSCDPASTKIDSKTGHVTLVCKKMKEDK